MLYGAAMEASNGVMMKPDRHRERRWIVLGEDGRFVTLGRASDPTDEEVAAAEANMRAQGVAGWLAVMEGNPCTVAQPTFLAVRPLAEPICAFEEAVAAFRARRA